MRVDNSILVFDIRLINKYYLFIFNNQIYVEVDFIYFFGTRADA